MQAGVALDFTFRNREAESALEQITITERRLKLEEQRTEQIVAAQVRNALQGIQTAKQRLLAAASGAKAAKDKLESEERLFQTGESTNFFVLTRQNEHLDSRRREVAAQLDLNKAIARLEQAAGKTLENHNVRLR